MTDERIAELRKLAEAATPGPWFPERVGGHIDPTSWHIADVVRWQGYTNALNFDEDEASCRYVAAVSPDVVLALLDEIDRLRGGQGFTKEWTP